VCVLVSCVLYSLFCTAAPPVLPVMVTRSHDNHLRLSSARHAYHRHAAHAPFYHRFACLPHHMRQRTLVCRLLVPHTTTLVPVIFYSRAARMPRAVVPYARTRRYCARTMCRACTLPYAATTYLYCHRTSLFVFRTHAMRMVVTPRAATYAVMLRARRRRRTAFRAVACCAVPRCAFARFTCLPSLPFRAARSHLLFPFC